MAQRWRIEKATSGRARCRTCAKPIDAGAYRFGDDGKWWHLVCAHDRNLYWYQPFKARGAKLLASGKAAAQAPAVKGGPAPRDAGLEARLAENPDAGMRAVFTDHLLAHGDPWGDVLALEHAGQTEKAEKLFAKHRTKLLGGLNPKLFTWKHRFLDTATLDSKRPLAMAEQQLEDVCGLRTAVLLRALTVPFPATDALMRRLSEKAPPALAELRCVLGFGAEGGSREAWGDVFRNLALPRLAAMTIVIRRAPGKAQLNGLWQNPKLPRLRALEMRAGSSPGLALGHDAVDALIASPLIRQLDTLTLHYGAMDDEGIRRLRATTLAVKMTLKVWD